jgi:hypothetical protein
MSIAYPIARSLEEAMRPGVPVARSRTEAETMATGRISRLEVSWLHLSEAEADALLASLGAEGPAGHLQRYEDTSGHVVIAVSWWKLAEPGTTVTAPSEPSGPTETPGAASDHTDDLYFRRVRTRPRRRRRITDPNQLDLFGDKPAS